MSQHGVRIVAQILFIEVNKYAATRFLSVLLMSSSVSYAALFGDEEAREQINALRKQVSEMEARIAKMEEALNNQALLELYTKVETLGLDLGKLNGQIEMLGNENTLLQKRP